LFALSLLALLLDFYLFQSTPVVTAAEEDGRAKLSSLNRQVTALYQAGKFSAAIPIAQEAVELSEKALGADHPDTAAAVNNLGKLYYSMGDYAKAEPLYQRALKIYEKALGPDRPETAQELNNLAELYRSNGDYAKAEPLYQRAIKIKEKAHTGDSYANMLNIINSQNQMFWNQQNSYNQSLSNQGTRALVDRVPEFPWPPPKASASDMIPDAMTTRT
jgi:Tfp pilus assembly protein PilF